MRGTRGVVKRVDLDRRTWASPTNVVFAFETNGAGSIMTPELEFGISYEGAPFFSSGVALVSGELTSGDYPFVTVGVAEWITKDVGDEDFIIKGIKPSHTGAILWINVSSRGTYKLRHSFVFQGTAFKNPMVN